MHNSENGNAAMEETGDVRYKPKGWRFSKDRCTRWFFELIYATAKNFEDFFGSFCRISKPRTDIPYGEKIRLFPRNSSPL